MTIDASVSGRVHGILRWRLMQVSLLTLLALGVSCVSADTNGELHVQIFRNGTDASLRWNSVTGETFTVSRASGLASNTLWTMLTTNWPASVSNSTEFRHTNVLPAAFFRVARNSSSNAPPPSFTFNWSGTNFTYSDAQRTFTGIMLKPDGAGPFPAVLIQHGAGGSVTNYSLSKARDMVGWGLVSIAPNLTHVTGGETNPPNMGFCPENLARAQACLQVLESLSYVDTNRLALFGHSMGAFATIGDASVFGTRVRAMGISSGGIIPDSAGTNNAAPTVSEANGVTAPTIMFHCDADTVVPPMRSQLLQDSLNSHSVTNQRILISSNTLPNTAWHNIHNDAGANMNVLTNTRAWFQIHGVLP